MKREPREFEVTIHKESEHKFIVNATDPNEAERIALELAQDGESGGETVIYLGTESIEAVDEEHMGHYVIDPLYYGEAENEEAA